MIQNMNSLLGNPFYLCLMLVFIIAALHLLWNVYPRKQPQLRKNVVEDVHPPRPPTETDQQKRRDIFCSKVNGRRTSVSRFPHIKSINEDVRDTMAGLLKHYHSKDLNNDNQDDAAASFANAFPYIENSDISVAELEEKILRGLAVKCVVEDSKRVIVAYKKKN